MGVRDLKRTARFPSAVGATSALLEWFGQDSPPSVDPRLWVEAKTALVEGFTNAVRHAQGEFRDPPPIEVGLALLTEPEGTLLELSILDQGPPFDLAAVLDSLEASEPDGRDVLDRDAHWGLIMLARLRSKYGWQVRYDRREEGGNKLLLRSPRSAANGFPSPRL
jgi:serine/threonine-protein kinase RsbW